MAEPIILDNAPTLWAGINNEQVKGDDLYRQTLPITKKGRYGQQVLKYVSSANYPMSPDELTRFLQKNIPQNQTPVLPQTATPASAFDAKAFFAANKWLVLGGVGLLAYMFLGDGLGATDRTVTSVTRYSPKSK